MCQVTHNVGRLYQGQSLLPCRRRSKGLSTRLHRVSRSHKLARPLPSPLRAPLRLRLLKSYVKGPLKYLVAKLRLLPRCKFSSGQPKFFRALFSAPARDRFKPLFNFFTSLQKTQKTLFDYIFID